MPSAALLARGPRDQGIGGPFLIKHGSDIPWADWLVAHTSVVAAQPFDGFVFDAKGTNGTNQLIHSATAVTLAQVTTDMANIGGSKTAFGTCSKYLPRILFTTNTPPDFWNDTTWTTIASNWANLASAALTAGCWGICFDPEYYGTGTNAWSWASSNPGSTYGDSGPDDPTVAATTGIDVGHTLAQSRTKAQARGKQIMDAVLAQWPSVRLLVLHGTYISTALTSPQINPSPPYNDIAFANELMGTFTAGLVQSIVAAGNKAILIDGGESPTYSSRSDNDFRVVNKWRQYGLPRSGQTVMDSTTAASYRSINGAGIYDKDFNTSGFPALTASQFQTYITYGMRNNPLTWLYTEQYDWWGTGFPTTPVPSAWPTAVSNARAAGRL